jgi:hypothetical protein
MTTGNRPGCAALEELRRSQQDQTVYIKDVRSLLFPRFRLVLKAQSLACFSSTSIHENCIQAYTRSEGSELLSADSFAGLKLIRKGHNGIPSRLEI